MKQRKLKDNQILLEPNKYKSLQANLDAGRMNIKVPARSIDTRNSIIQTLVTSQENFIDLLNANDPTQIPFLTTSQGNILVNPSTVSIETLQKIASNEVVAKCLDMNVVSILNSLGELTHEDKKIQRFLRENYNECNGGMRRIVENIATDQIFGFSTNYIRDYIDNRGFLRLEQIDLLPPSTILFTSTGRGDIENIFMYIYTYPYANTQNLFSFPFNYSNNGSQPFASEGIDPLASYSNAGFLLRTNILNTFGLVSLDLDKVIHSVSDNMIKIANPYGWNPLTRRVYDIVQLYDLYKQLHSTFLSYKACPLLVGYAKESGQVDDPLNPGMTMTNLDGLYRSMSELGFNGALLLSGLEGERYQIEAIQSEGNTDAFDKALEWYKREIEQCLGLFSNEESSYASATTQTGFYGRLINDRKNRIADKIKTTINRRLIHANFSPTIKDYGTFESEIQNIDDQLKQVKQYRELVATTGFNPGILKKDNDTMRRTLKLDILTDAEFKELKNAAIEAEHPMDNSSGTNSKESKAHYSHGANSDV